MHRSYELTENEIKQLIKCWARLKGLKTARVQLNYVGPDRQGDTEYFSATVSGQEDVTEQEFEAALTQDVADALQRKGKKR